MPSNSFQRQKASLKRKIQASLLFIACALALLIYSYQYFLSPSESDASPSQRKLISTNGYYIESLNEFPPLPFSYQQIKDWAWILYFIGMFYTFVGIAIICDDYFVPVVEIIAIKLNMTEDTAGATWLAIGTSAPELFTAFVGTFVAQSDVGFGTIIGSAVFNVLLIIGACAIFTAGDLKLQWWSFVRDCLFFLISLGFLAMFAGGVSKHEMYWWECLVLLLLYVLYVVLMKYNTRIKDWFFNKYVYSKHEKQLLEQKDANGTDYGSSLAQNGTNIIVVSNENGADLPAAESPVISDPNSIEMSESREPKRSKSTSVNDGVESDEEAEGLDHSWPDKNWARCTYIICAPFAFLMYLTCADMTKKKNEKYWLWTFISCLLWLGGLSYLMVWWAVCVGYAWDVPQVLMGLVFLAAGTSVPELFSCVIVAKKGKADMAVSGSIGSNIFDILVGLPLPWLSFALTQSGFHGDIKIDVRAQGIYISILVLIVMLACLVILILVNKWILTHCMGWTMVGLYLLFVAQDLLRYYWLEDLVAS